MIITRTPFRLSFLGGGTDYPAWYRKHGGAVLSTTIDKYCYITCRYLPPFHEHRISARLLAGWSTATPSTRSSIRRRGRCSEVSEGRPRRRDPHDADLPGRSGMGSSSAFTVGLLHAIHALQGRMVGKQQLAIESMHLEQEVLKEAVGSQDQVHAAYGGLNHVLFHPNGEISVRPVTISPQRMAEFNAHLMMFYTGIKRTASDVAGTFVNGMEERQRQLRIMKDLVDEGLADPQCRTRHRRFGELLHEAWQAKRSLSATVSNSEVDALYARARSRRRDRRQAHGRRRRRVPAAVREARTSGRPCARSSSDLIHVPFKFEFSGSQIIYYEPDAGLFGERAGRARRRRSRRSGSCRK